MTEKQESQKVIDEEVEVSKKPSQDKELVKLMEALSCHQDVERVLENSLDILEFDLPQESQDLDAVHFLKYSEDIYKAIEEYSVAIKSLLVLSDLSPEDENSSLVKNLKIKEFRLNNRLKKLKIKIKDIQEQIIFRVKLEQVLENN